MAWWRFTATDPTIGQQETLVWARPEEDSHCAMTLQAHLGEALLTLQRGRDFHLTGASTLVRWTHNLEPDDPRHGIGSIWEAVAALHQRMSLPKISTGPVATRAT